MTRTQVFLGIAICGAFIFGTYTEGATEHNARARKTTVCAISADPARFAGKVVVVSARYESDGIERSILTDTNCKDDGIAILTPEHFVGEAALTKALSTGRPGTLDKTITGTFVGMFRWEPKKVPKRVLVLKEVRNLSAVAR